MPSSRALPPPLPSRLTPFYALLSAAACRGAQHRHEFETATFRILFAACAGCDPHLTLSLEPLERAAPFGKAEQAREGTEHDVLSYRPLYFRSRVVEG